MFAVKLMTLSLIEGRQSHEYGCRESVLKREWNDGSAKQAGDAAAV